MLSPLNTFREELQRPFREQELRDAKLGATSQTRGDGHEENGASPMQKTLAPGMGTKNFVTKILEDFAALDQEGKQKLINYSTQLVEEQRAVVEQRAAEPVLTV
jgi:isocitrate dehydrogenase kinase/phosphatase